MVNKKDHVISTDKMVGKYLTKISVSKKDFYASKEIPIESTKLIILLGLKDFFDNKISINDIDSLAHIYWTDTRTWDPKEWDRQDKKLGTVLLWLSELSYYSRRSKEFPDLEKIRKHIINVAKDYYDEFKDLIKEY